MVEGRPEMGASVSSTSTRKRWSSTTVARLTRGANLLLAGNMGVALLDSLMASLFLLVLLTSVVDHLDHLLRIEFVGRRLKQQTARGQMLGRQTLTVATAGSTMNSMAQVVEYPIPELVLCPGMCFSQACKTDTRR